MYLILARPYLDSGRPLPFDWNDILRGRNAGLQKLL